MNLRFIEKIGDEPVSVDEAKRQLRYTASDQDVYIAGLIAGARHLAERWNGRRQVLSQWTLALDRWPTGHHNWGRDLFAPGWQSDPYRLLMPDMAFHPKAIPLLAPLVSVDSVIYTDSTGTATTLTENTDYIVDTFKEPGIILPAFEKEWPCASLWPSSAIKITFKSGKVPDVDEYVSENPSAPSVLEVTHDIKNGILMLVTQWFADRVTFDAIRSIAEPPFAITALFTSDKLWA